MYYHLIRSNGYAIYTSETNEPWNEEMKLLQFLLDECINASSWEKTWRLIHTPFQNIQDIFKGYCVYTSENLESVIGQFVLETL